MRHNASLVAALFLTLAALRIPAQERQVPFDTEGRILVITRAVANQLGLYQDYPGFKEAILLQSDADSYVLEIRQEEEGLIVQERVAMTGAEVTELRARISALIAERSPTSLLDQSGRFALLLGDVILSYGFYGWAVPLSLEISDFTVSTGLYLITSGMGFFVPFFLTRRAEVTPAQATLSLGAATLGILHGVGVCGLIAGNAMDFTGLMPIPVLVSIAEGVAGYFLAKPLKVSSSEAGLIDFMGLVGFGEGALISYLSGSESRESFTREIFGCSLAGSAGGLVLGKLMANWTHVTAGDMLLIADTTILGMMGAGCLLALFEIYQPQPLSGILMAGLTGGVTTGYLLQARKDFSIGRMNIISLCMVGGALVGSGLGYLVFPNALYELPWFIPTMGFLGSGLAFGITLAVLDPTEGSEAGKRTALSLSVHPESLLGLRHGRNLEHPPALGVQLELRY